MILCQLRDLSLLQFIAKELKNNHVESFVEIKYIQEEEEDNSVEVEEGEGISEVEDLLVAEVDSVAAEVDLEVEEEVSEVEEEVSEVEEEVSEVVGAEARPQVSAGIDDLA